MAEAVATLIDRASEQRTNAPRQAQVNARIDARLKEEGDAGLAAAGYTPTQAVRSLWELASRHRDDPAAIRSALDPTDGSVTPDELAERQRRLDALRRGLGLLESFYERQGIAGVTDPLRQQYSDDEYYELLREEHFREKGYLL